jgi:hypothetical protein
MDAITLAKDFSSNKGWSLIPVFNLGLLVADVPSPRDAVRVVDRYTDYLAMSAFKLGFNKAVIKHPGLNPGEYAYEIPIRMAIMGDETQGAMSIVSDNQMNLLGADYIRIHEFLIEQRQSGNIVIVTSNITRDEYGNPISTTNPQAGRDICHHTNDLLLPSRAYWSPQQFTGYNYRLSWRSDRDDYERLNPQYDRLKEILIRDGYASNYEYTLYRPDGAKCSYSTAYFLCRDYLGDEVRIGVSRPQDWQLLEPVAA